MKKINDIIEFFKLLKLRYAGNVPYQNIFIIGFFIGFITYFKLERNWIPIELLISITICSSILITISFWRFYKRELNLIWAFFHNLTYGFLISFLFVISNDILSNKPEITNQYYIKDLKLVYGNGNRRQSTLKPEFIIEIDGKDRVFNVHDSRFKQFVNNRKAYLTIKKGFWGYDIVKSLKFENEI